MNFWLLDRQNESVRDELDEAYNRVMKSGQFILGKENETCEELMQKMFGVKHVILTSSGTTALEISLRVYDNKSGRLYESWRGPPISFIASQNAISYSGRDRSFVSHLHCNLTVDLYGLPEEPSGEIRDSCQAHNLALMKTLPGDSVAATLSFFPTKAIGALGDAGAILTNNTEFAHECRALRDHGRASHGDAVAFGTNARCDELQAAFIKVKLWSFPYWQYRRRKICKIWDEVTGYNHGEWGPYLYPVWSEDRDGLQKRLAGYNIPSKVYYKEPLFYTEESYRFCNTVLCLNPDPFLTEKEVDNICVALEREFSFIERPEL